MTVGELREALAGIVDQDMNVVVHGDIGDWSRIGRVGRRSIMLGHIAENALTLEVEDVPRVKGDAHDAVDSLIDDLEDVIARHR